MTYSWVFPKPSKIMFAGKCSVIPKTIFCSFICFILQLNVGSRPLKQSTGTRAFPRFCHLLTELSLQSKCSLGTRLETKLHGTKAIWLRICKKLKYLFWLIHYYLMYRLVLNRPKGELGNSLIQFDFLCIGSTIRTLLPNAGLVFYRLHK